MLLSICLTRDILLDNFRFHRLNRWTLGSWALGRWALGDGRCVRPRSGLVLAAGLPSVLRPEVWICLQVYPAAGVCLVGDRLRSACLRSAKDDRHPCRRNFLVVTYLLRLSVSSSLQVLRFNRWPVASGVVTAPLYVLPLQNVPTLCFPPLALFS